METKLLHPPMNVPHLPPQYFYKNRPFIIIHAGGNVMKVQETYILVERWWRQYLQFATAFVKRRVNASQNDSYHIW